MDIRKYLKELLGLDALPKGEGLAGFSTEQLAEAETKAQEAFASAKESRDVVAAEAAVEAIETIRVESTARAEAEAAVNSKLDELANRVVVEKDEDEAEEEEASDEDAKDEAESEVVVEAEETAPAVEDAPAEDAEEKVLVTAAAPAAPAPTKTPKPKGKPAPAKPKVTIVAAGDVENFSAGQIMEVSQIGEAFVNKAEAVRGSRTLGQTSVVTIKSEIGPERTLDQRFSPERNSEIIDAVVAAAQEETRKTLRRIMATRDPEELHVLQAAGGLCAPVDTDYSILEIGEDNRPLRDSLPRFNAKRGGLRYIDGDTVPYMADVQGALGHFTEAEDTSGAEYPKPCLRVNCPTWIETLVEADTLCMIVGMWERLTFPENFRAWWKQAFNAKARAAEERLWDDMVALTTAVTAGEGLGATSDTLTQVERAATQMRWRFRISPNTPLRLWAPDFLQAIMRTDLARRAPGDGLGVLGVSDGELARHFAARNIAVTYVLDGQTPGGTSGDIQAAGALNPWPSTVDVILAIEGTFFHLDMGGLNFGTDIRDFDMIRNNDVGAFLETFENVARRGPQALTLTLNICPDGTTAGPNTSFDPCVSGS